MPLESIIDTTMQSLLKAGKWTDKQILREYSKLVKSWEANGMSKYSLAAVFNITGLCSFFFSGWASNLAHPKPVVACPEYVQEYLPYEVSSWIASFGLGGDFHRNMEESIDAKLNSAKNMSDGAIAEQSPFGYFQKKIGEAVRLPLLITGLAYIGTGIFELFDYFQNNNTHSLNHALADLSFGYAFFANASSIYVKDNDSKLIEKDSAWKQALDWIKSKTKYIACPAPVLQPVNLRATYSNITRDKATYSNITRDNSLQ